MLVLTFGVLRHTATHCNTPQYTATHCNTLQHTATHCNIPHHVLPLGALRACVFLFHYIHTHINTYTYENNTVKGVHVPHCSITKMAAGIGTVGDRYVCHMGHINNTCVCVNTPIYRCSWTAWPKMRRHTVAPCCTLQHTATHCNILQHSVAHCNTLQNTEARYSTLH